MPVLGAHMSIAGGYYKAIERGVAAGCDCIQVFTKNNNQWRGKELTDEEAEAFREAVANSSIQHVVSHSSYLINLAAAEDELWRKSVDAMEVELQRANALGIPDVVLHPGAHTVLTEEQGLSRVIDALDELHRRTEGLGCDILLETTAGQGTCLGWRFEQLQQLLEGVEDTSRLGVCVDTCHLHAAGYDLTTKVSFMSTIREFHRKIGLERLRAIHVNDSKRELGCRVDRHEHIGLGEMKTEPFRLLLNDRRFRKIPMYLETAKGEDENGVDWDVKNLGVLRSLVE